MSNIKHVPEGMTSAYTSPVSIHYPTNAVVGVLDTAEQLDGAVAALGNGGFWTSEIEVAAGEEAAEAVRATTGRTGFIGLVLRFAQWLGVRDDELEHKAHYEHELREGHFVVVVQTPSERRKERAAKLLRTWGAHSLSYHGRYTIEELTRARYA